MGADLYINKIHDAQMKKYEPKFNEAVKIRNAVGEKLDKETINEILKIINGGKPTDFFDDPKPVPENVELPARLRPFQHLYNDYCNAQSNVTKYHNLMYDKGYFRDSYNGTSLFWRLGLSWWNDVKEYTNGKSKITPAGAKKLLEKIKSTRLKPVTYDYLKEHNCRVDDGEDSVRGWQKYFRNKKRRFIHFLETAIKENTNIYCSV